MKHRYNGPLSGLHLAGTGEVVLIDGKEYDLPPDSKDVQRLVGLKFLTPLETAPATPAKVDNKGDSNVG
ncbi:hypothetical protein [Chromobacterium haemolyticum]|uniref:hypothetical protein n=1 Tax=Chromobacterium haemolyticum TaxID=394935 RepID=UPI00174653C0|nr:hypothetical protein [Chromobacterium haemolyticum]QOD81889.1 hypothetical protein IEZ30_18645 [Chromobacterium haemolyticum]